MTASAVLLSLAVGCAALAAVSAVLMAAALDHRGLKTPLPLQRAFVFRNLSRYRDVTRTETGKTGALFYTYVVPINLALLLVLAALLAWWVTR